MSTEPNLGSESQAFLNLVHFAAPQGSHISRLQTHLLVSFIKVPHLTRFFLCVSYFVFILLLLALTEQHWQRLSWSTTLNMWAEPFTPLLLWQRCHQGSLQRRVPGTPHSWEYKLTLLMDPYCGDVYSFWAGVFLIRSGQCLFVGVDHSALDHSCQPGSVLHAKCRVRLNKFPGSFCDSAQKTIHCSKSDFILVDSSL